MIICFLHPRLSSWIEAQHTCEKQNMVLSADKAILEGHIRTHSDVSDVHFLGLRKNEKVIEMSYL